MLDDASIALALGLSLFTALITGRNLPVEAAAARIVSIADLPSPGPVVEPPRPLLWVAGP